MQLSLEEKQYLYRICNLIKSYRVEVGEIELYIFPGDDLPINKISSTLRYSNYEIPEKLQLLIKKIYDNSNYRNYIIPQEIYDSSQTEFIVIIDVDEKKIKFVCLYEYYQKDDRQEIEYHINDDPESLTEIFDELKSLTSENLRLDYDGSGDSGSIGFQFENGLTVPENARDWSYYKLENNFAGWENDAGCEGYFVFDLESETVTLNHWYFEYVSDEMDFYTVSFEL